ncbi:TRAMP complex RNA-binding subunit [Saccharomycopsis crataegensis]|uniref:TRAMP complex RNA-binding subunit n=1 Tax=Saccharomycopsis crataegensis TaxID=43959 RepID=A0AAV5QIQ1_9ASCO|nr:TRAMP complex RNA-binding subunit [Saccharomycopsis crataegensis]
MASAEVRDSQDKLTGKTFSLNLEEVNNNPDELIDMRGQGRYFGNADETIDMVCRNCHKTGHKAAHCKTVICLACGAIDDHYSDQCPRSITCTNCGEKGHYKNACTKRSQRIFCTLCESNKHNRDRCPSIWRSYITFGDKNGKLLYPFRSVFCYNCAAKGHFGDDCPGPRSSRIPNFDGSSFSGDNLPRDLRDQYFHLLRKRSYEDDESEGSKSSSSSSWGGNFFHYDYDKDNQQQGLSKNHPKFEKTKKGKKEKKKQQKLEKKSKKEKELENQRKRRKIDHSNSQLYDNAPSYNKKGNVIIKPKRSGKISAPTAPLKNSASYQRPVPTFNSRGNIYNQGYNNRNDFKPQGRSGYLPPKRSNDYDQQRYSGGRTSFNIQPSRSGTLGKDNNKSNNNNRKRTGGNNNRKNYYRGNINY